MTAQCSCPTIDTPRLVLRCPLAGDFDSYRPALMSDRAIHMGGPFDLAAAWKDFCMDVAGWALHGHGALAITDRVKGTFHGMVALTRRPDFPERELGWVLLKTAEGRGIAFEAADALRDFAFGHLGWRTLVSYIAPENARSIALAERLGAKRDAHAPRPDPTDLVYRHFPTMP